MDQKISNINERATAEPMDTFRKTYKELSDSQKDEMNSIKEFAEHLEGMYINLSDKGYDGRALSLAKTKLEESVMWAVKAVTK